MKKLQQVDRLNFAAINPADIVFFEHYVQISRRKAVPLTTSRERFLEAVNEARQKAAEKEAAKKRYDAEKAKHEAIRAAVKATRDQEIVECPICPDGQKNVLMGYTRILFEKDRARRVCNRCFKARRESLAKQREKEARIAADKAAEEWLNQMKAPARVAQLPVEKIPESKNAETVFNAPKGLEAVAEMLAEVKPVVAATVDEATKPKAKRKPKSISAEPEAKSLVKKPRAKRAPEMTASV